MKQVLLRDVPISGNFIMSYCPHKHTRISETQYKCEVLITSWTIVPEANIIVDLIEEETSNE